MKHVLIVENNSQSLKVNESATGSTKFLLNGIFTEFDIENRNKRFYTAENFVPCMNRMLEKKNLLGVLYGEFDHPDVFDIAGKNISHAIESLVYNESANRIDGSIALLSTHYGKEAKAIINDGFPLFVSSRAAGVTDGNGNVSLKEMFTYDIVVDPGFASSRVSVNESLGYNTSNETQYRIYEMNDSQVNNLFNDNKNDNKTKMDLTKMETLLAEELAKFEFQIMSKITEGKTAPEELKSMLEKYELVNEELVNVKTYLEEFKKSVNFLVKENTKLNAENKKLNAEINENTLYSNHLASGLKQLNDYSNDIESRLEVGEKMIEYVAEHAKANILFTEDIAKEHTITQKFVESVAKETEVAQKFAEHIANEAKNIANESAITRQFAEYIANEAKLIKEEVTITQGFAEHVANEAYGDQVFLNYIANKVDGIVGYTTEMVTKIKSTTPVNETLSIEDIHTLENISDYLGITEEQDVLHNMEPVNEEETEKEETEDNTEETEEESTELEDVTETPEDNETEHVDNTEETDDVVLPIETVETEPDFTGELDLNVELPVVDLPLGDNTNEFEPTEVVEPIENVEPIETSMETTLLQSLVKVLGSDETGIVVEVTPEGKIIIQKSGSDELSELEPHEVEVMNMDENITETVNDVLAEIKKQKVLSNQQPHFFTFLSEEQITDFKMLEKVSQNNITLKMNESEYMSTSDVLNIIGNVLNENSISYEDKLISNIPDTIKESWNAFTKEQKVSIITESKYFNLSTTADIKSFWDTRPFAKAITSPEAVLIKESLNSDNTEEFNEDYINAFLKSMDNLK